MGCVVFVGVELATGLGCINFDNLPNICWVIRAGVSTTVFWRWWSVIKRIPLFYIIHAVLPLTVFIVNSFCVVNGYIRVFGLNLAIT